MRFFANWRGILAYMVLFPWPDKNMPDSIAGEVYVRDDHVAFWSLGWLVSVAGIVGVGFYAPYWTDHYTNQWLPFLQGYTEYTITGLAIIGGILWQFFAVSLRSFMSFVNDNFDLNDIFAIGIPIFAIVLPFAATGLLIYWYLTHFAPNHDLVGSSIVSATAVKILISFILPWVKGLITGAIGSWALKRVIGSNKKGA